MFATWSFAEVAFAVQQLIGVVPPLPIAVPAGISAKRKKKKRYEILGKQYELTDKEYESYLAQRKKYLKSIENTIVEAVVESPNNDLTSITFKDLIGEKTFKPMTLNIPFVEKIVDVIDPMILLELVQKQQKERIKKNIAQDDADFEILLQYGMIL